MNPRADFDSAALSYNSVADVYERARPGYRPEVVARVREIFAAGPGDVVVDLAAGTGKLTRELVGSGATVVAFEPVAAMARQLVEAVPGVPVARAYAGALPLPDRSVSAMAVAQAFQWFGESDVDEIARVLRDGAPLALVWNRRQPTGVWQRVDGVIGRHRRVGRRRVDAPAVLRATPWFTPATVERRPWTRRLDRSELLGHIESLSWVAALEPGERASVLDEVDDAIGSGDTFELDYESELVFTRRR